MHSIKEPVSIKLRQNWQKKLTLLTVISTTFLPAALWFAANSATMVFVSFRFAGALCFEKYSSQSAILIFMNYMLITYAKSGKKPQKPHLNLAQYPLGVGGY